MATDKSNAGFLSSSCLMIDTSFDLDEALTMPDHVSYNNDQIADSNSLVLAADDLPVSVLQTADIDDSNIVCAVCMEAGFQAAAGKRVPCGHVYHEECISSWLSHSDSCPLCRCRISAAS